MAVSFYFFPSGIHFVFDIFVDKNGQSYMLMVFVSL
jgi:hypothetical protein